MDLGVYSGFHSARAWLHVWEDVHTACLELSGLVLGTLHGCHGFCKSWIPLEVSHDEGVEGFCMGSSP